MTQHAISQTSHHTTPNKETALMIDLVRQETEFCEALRQYYAHNTKPEREPITNIVEALSSSSFRAVYRKLQPLGFKPALSGDGETNPKERRRVGTFLHTLFENQQWTARNATTWLEETPSI